MALEVFLVRPKVEVVEEVYEVFCRCLYAVVLLNVQESRDYYSRTVNSYF